MSLILREFPAAPRPGAGLSFGVHAPIHPPSPHEDRAAMIPRYARPAMTAIWEPDNKFRIWFEIEAHACDAQAKLGVIPVEAAKAVWQRGKWDIQRIDEIEKETKHD